MDEIFVGRIENKKGDFYVAFPEKVLLTAEDILKEQRKATKGIPGNKMVDKPLILFAIDIP